MRVVLAAVAAVAILLVVFLVVLRSATNTAGPDCSGFSLKPGQWQATSAGDRSDLQLKIAGCRALTGKSAGEVQTLLGPPTKGDPATEVAYAFGPSDPRSMYVRFDAGRVVEVGRNGPPVAS